MKLERIMAGAALAVSLLAAFWAYEARGISTDEALETATQALTEAENAQSTAENAQRTAKEALELAEDLEPRVVDVESKLGL